MAIAAIANAPQHEVVDVTPELATSWLQKNVKNRPLRERVANKYATDMRDGRWRFTGEPIKFAYDGALLDGQHRLAAVVRAEVTLPLLVVRGLHPTAQQVLDGGPRRSLKDALKLNGELHYTTLAPSLRYFWLADSGKSFEYATSEGPSVPQALAVLDAHPEARDGASAAVSLNPHIPMSSAVIAYRWCQFSELDEADRDDFFYRLSTLSFRGETDPLRQFITLLQQDKARVKRKYDTLMLHALMVKAWNYYRTGRDVQILSWKRGGSIREDFPEAI